MSILLKDIVARVGSNHHELAVSGQMRLHEEWRLQFADRLRQRLVDELGCDVVIRCVALHRVHQEARVKPRMSSSFRVALIGQHHNCIEVCLSTHSLAWEKAEQSWRWASTFEQERETILAYLIGHIPYPEIVSVIWDDDVCSAVPHIYCHYKHDGTPYERLVYCERHRARTGLQQFAEIGTFESVRLTSEKCGTDWVSQLRKAASNLIHA